MTKDIIERLQQVADIKDASSIPPEFLDNTVFLQIMKDAIAEIKNLRFNVQSYQHYQRMALYQATPTTTTTTNTMPYTTTTVPTTISPVDWQMPVSATMIYTEMEQKALADKAVEAVVAEAAKNLEPAPAQDEKDRLWDLVKSSVEGGG